MNKEIHLFGKLLQHAVVQRSKEIGKPYSVSRLATESGVFSSQLWRVCYGEGHISAERVQQLCNTLQCSPAMQKALYNSAGHAAPQDEASAEAYLAALEGQDTAQDTATEEETAADDEEDDAWYKAQAS